MHDTHKLSKILARLDSPHEGEVTVAIRLAQGMLAKQNLSLTDVLASGLRQMGGKTSPKTNPPTVHMHAETTAVSLRHITALQQRLMALEENYKALEQIATSQEHEIKQWRERDRQWKSAQTLYQQQIDHWKKLAEDVTEKLWAIGRQLVPLQKRISERGFNEQALWRAGEAGATLGPPQGQARGPNIWGHGLSGPHMPGSGSHGRQPVATSPEQLPGAFNLTTPATVTEYRGMWGSHT